MNVQTLKLAVGVVTLTCLLATVGCGDDDAVSGGTGSNPQAGEVEPAVTPGPTQTSVPIDPNPSIPAGEPVYWEIEGSHEHPTANQIAWSTEHVLVGTVREHLPPRWSTVDGSRPEEVLNGNLANTIYTPVVVEVEQPLLLDVDNVVGEAKKLIILIEGGTIDEVSIKHTGSFYDFPIGARVVLGATPVMDGAVPNISPDIARQLTPEGFDKAFVPMIRFIIKDGIVSSDGFNYPEDEFFSMLRDEIAKRRAS